jgi:hypothetical protein
MNAWHFALNTWIVLIPDLTGNQETRVFFDEEAYGVDVFRDGVNFTSVSEPLSEDNVIDQMVWFVLNNCSQVEKYVCSDYYILYSIFVMHIC